MSFKPVLILSTLCLSAISSFAFAGSFSMALDSKTLASDSCFSSRTSTTCITKEKPSTQAMSYVDGLSAYYQPAASGDSTMYSEFSPFLEVSWPGLFLRETSNNDSQVAIFNQANQFTSGVGPVFDVDLFADNIRSLLDGNTAGYAYAITKGGVLATQGAGGKLRKAGEGNINQSATKRQNIASISKMITAVAVLKLMDQLNLDLNDKIAPYLPQSWNLGSNVEDLTFEHLLRHRTGFISQNNDFWNTLSWNGLSTMVAAGANPGASFNYLNANFALFRFIIPAMWKEAGAPYPIYTENGTAAAFWYIFYMQENLFKPIGINMAQCMDPSSSTEALYYDPAASLNGVPGGDWNMICGSGGWVLSANDLVNFMTHYSHDNNYLSKEMRDLMMGNRLGVYKTTGAYGDYFSHGGVIGWGGGQGMVMCAMRYSISVEAAVLVNSGVNGIAASDFCNTVLRDTFDAAWQ